MSSVAVGKSRLNELREAQGMAQSGHRYEWGNLSEAERQELIHYEALMEQHRVDSLKVLMAIDKY